MLNLSVLSGVLSTPPEIRLLDSGSRLATLQVQVPGPDGRTTSVPVAVWDPPTTVETFAEGDPVVVVGRTRRRFFRTRSGTTGSRVEVVAEQVLRPTQRQRIEACVRRCTEALHDIT